VSEQDNKAKRNVLLFWGHVVLAVFFLAWFVLTVVSK
jgi:hypothetical protein